MQLIVRSIFYFDISADRFIQKLSHVPELIDSAPAEERKRRIQTAQVVEVGDGGADAVAVVVDSDCVVFISKFAPQSSERQSQLFIEQIMKEVASAHGDLRVESIVGIMVHHGHFVHISPQCGRIWTNMEKIWRKYGGKYGHWVQISSTNRPQIVHILPYSSILVAVATVVVAIQSVEEQRPVLLAAHLWVFVDARAATKGWPAWADEWCLRNRQQQMQFVVTEIWKTFRGRKSTRQQNTE